MYGTPVLGADIGGIPELIREGKTGALFESGNTAELIRKIKNLYFDNATLETYSAACKNVDFCAISWYTDMVLHIFKD